MKNLPKHETRDHTIRAPYGGLEGTLERASVRIPEAQIHSLYSESTDATS